MRWLLCCEFAQRGSIQYSSFQSNTSILSLIFMTASQSHTPDPTTDYMPQLDALRAFAVIAVAFSHWVPKSYHLGFEWGTAGVQLFFVLSGFLITGILLRCRDYDDRVHALRAFYARRFLRIFPLYYAVLAIALLLNIPPVRDTIVWHVLYLSNFYFFDRGGWHGPISHFWSLAVEEQFYLVWPAIVLFVGRRWLLPSMLAIVLIAMLTRIAIPTFAPDWTLWTVLPIPNLDALGLGALIAYAAQKGWRSPLVDYAWIAALVALIIVVLRQAMGATPTPIVAASDHWSLLVFFGWLIVRCSQGVQGPAKPLLESRWLRYIGKISYGIYVLHNFAPFPVRLLADGLHQPWLDQGLTRLLFLSLVTIAGASLSWYYLELPLNALKSRFPYRRKRECSGASCANVISEPSVHSAQADLILHK